MVEIMTTLHWFPRRVAHWDALLQEDVLKWRGGVHSGNVVTPASHSATICVGLFEPWLEVTLVECIPVIP